MANWLKISLIITGIGLILSAGFVYTSFFGTPWGKYFTAKKLHAQVEEKYDIQVEISDRYYNFKDGKYGARFTVLDGEYKGLTFSGESYSSQTLYDYYPEAVWKKQLSDEVSPTLNQLFPNPEFIAIDGVYGIGQDLQIEKDIPHFTEIESRFFIAVHLTKEWSEKTEAETIEKTYRLVSLLQEKDIQNVEVTIYFEVLDDSKHMNFINIPATELNNIKQKEDIKKYIKHN
ncbi:hypothetical protein LCL95_00920 [Bacillus timonensis]|nr:hypothetical protein [Bacillus timonensis]